MAEQSNNQSPEQGPTPPLPPGVEDMSRAERAQLVRDGVIEAGSELDPYKAVRAHLFKPGQSGNPGGRPKDSRTMRARVQQMLRSSPKGFNFTEIVTKGLGLPPEFVNTCSMGDLLALVALYHSCKGSPGHFAKLCDIADGIRTGDSEGASAADMAQRLRDIAASMEAADEAEATPDEDGTGASG